MKKYPMAERFFAPQGEGLFAGTQMAFLRTVGCSVGQGVCTSCDTQFDRTYPEMGGGMFNAGELVWWADKHDHVCITGGEPLDRDLRELLLAFDLRGVTCHVETSGTKHPDWLDATVQPRPEGKHAVQVDLGEGRSSWRWLRAWVTVSPKPGFLDAMVERVADEIKVILGGLGDGPGWPTVADALRWAAAGKLVYVQPRNNRLTVDADAMAEALAVVAEHPQLRLSTQLHKYLKTR